ncbi:MAG: polysaccharide biosynthesis/export family protein [Verrucomicrobiaceae bacterium]
MSNSFYHVAVRLVRMTLVLASLDSAVAQDSPLSSNGANNGQGGGGQLTGSTPQRSLASMAQAVAPSYQINIGDVVAVSVYQEDDLTTTARVGEGGVIAFPLLGNVKISGLSIGEATQTITARLKDGFLVSPMVSLVLVEQQRQKFTLMGQVQRPGQYELPPSGSMSLMEAIGLAGGFTRIARASRITVQRGTGPALEVDGKEQASGKARTVFKVLAGDVITVKESFF